MFATGHILVGPAFSEPIRVVTIHTENPAKLPWAEVMKVQHYAVALQDLRRTQA